MGFDPGLAIHWNKADAKFEYGDDIFGPEPEYRRLNDIRRTLLDPDSSGPETVYTIAMDVGRKGDRLEIERRMLLFGVVSYARGRVGREPVRSQGHVHHKSPHSGWSAPELFEIWEGSAIVYAQQYVANDPGKCIAIMAHPGDRVVVPPGWAHFVANADPNSILTFGAWCDRQYGFEYEGVRERGGLAWFPVFNEDGSIDWESNPNYKPMPANGLVQVHQARAYPELGVDDDGAAYGLFFKDATSLDWIANPGLYRKLWLDFEP